MKTTFKEFIGKQDSHVTDFIHHIAEEELISCKVISVELESNTGGVSKIKIVADCNDKPRRLGFQKDLSNKLTKRLELHSLLGLGKIITKVYHSNIDPR